MNHSTDGTEQIRTRFKDEIQNNHHWTKPTLQMLGLPGAMPDIFVEIEVKYYLLKRLLGVAKKDGESSSKVKVGIFVRRTCTRSYNC